MNPANQSITLKSLMFFAAAVLLALPGRVSAISRRREARLEPRRKEGVRATAPQEWATNEG
jgi:hypothetical protein